MFAGNHGLYTMGWRTELSEEIQQMKHRNHSSRFAGGWGYTSANIEDGRRENERINKYAKDKMEQFHKIEIKEFEEKIEAKNNYLKGILLALPYIKDDIQSILDKYPPVFQVETGEILKDMGYLTDCPGISREKTVISGHMLTDLYEAFAMCLRVIKSKKQSQGYNDYVDRIYNKSTVLEGSSKTSYDHIISRAQALHFLYDANTILELLKENSISHEYTDKPSTGQAEITELYMKIGTRYLRLFIKPQIDKKVDHIILNSYGKSSAGNINGIKHYAINHIRTTTRINELSKLELKRQEQERINAEVQRRLEKEEFEKKVAARLQEKKKYIQKKPPIEKKVAARLQEKKKYIQKKPPIEENVIVKLQENPTIVMKDSIQNYIERMDKDISRISLLGEL